MHITVAAPIVSVACIFLTRLLVRSILRILIASDSVTAIGRPSGIATTIRVTATIKCPSIRLATSSETRASDENILNPSISPVITGKENIKKPVKIQKSHPLSPLFFLLLYLRIGIQIFPISASNPAIADVNKII
ncbi:hypothetical protein SDC9_75502 [bioreactor metagenome]|uniref:Uncharacterized protein n=1 Tax=bioreactor metagenome TaxID=1076179 RepID=A0A644YSC0_9ZZZZ